MFGKKALILSVVFVLLSCSCGMQNGSNVSDEKGGGYPYLEAELKRNGINCEVQDKAFFWVHKGYAQMVLGAFYENDKALIKGLIDLQKLIHVESKIIDQGALERGKTMRLFRNLKIRIDAWQNQVSRAPVKNSSLSAGTQIDKFVDVFDDDITIVIDISNNFPGGYSPANIISRQIALAKVMATMEPVSNANDSVQFFMPNPMQSVTRALTFAAETFHIDEKNFDALITLLKQTDLRDLFGPEKRPITFGFKEEHGNKKIRDREDFDKRSIFRKLGSDVVTAVKEMINENK